MRKGSIKSDRINHEVRRAISEVLQNEMRDPRIHPMTSVTKAEVTPDLKYCKVLVSVLASEEEKAETMAGLRQATPFIRRRLAGIVNLRNTPELKFVLDDGIEYGMNLSRLIEEVKAEDDRAIAARGEAEEIAEPAEEVAEAAEFSEADADGAGDEA